MEDKCFNHPDKKPYKICFSCKRSFCNNCLTMENDNYYCFSDGCQLALKIDKVEYNKKQKNDQTDEFIQSPILTRFINFITDIVLFRTIMDLTLGQFLSDDLSKNFQPKDYLILGIEIILLFLYYFLFETFLQKTPGKYFTRTKVIMRDGSKPTAFDIIKRTLFRFMPFEVFSLKNSTWWHDRLSNTIVINEVKKSIDQNNDI